MWCTVCESCRAKNQLIGVRGAPIRRRSCTARCGMVHEVFHFDKPRRKNRTGWCMGCTILTLFPLKMAPNGASGPPKTVTTGQFWGKMVHCVHHLQRFRRLNGSIWCMWCTVFGFRNGNTHRNGASGAPF